MTAVNSAIAARAKMMAIAEDLINSELFIAIVSLRKSSIVQPTTYSHRTRNEPEQTTNAQNRMGEAVMAQPLNLDNQKFHNSFPASIIGTGISPGSCIVFGIFPSL